MSEGEKEGYSLADLVKSVLIASTLCLIVGFIAGAIIFGTMARGNPILGVKDGVAYSQQPFQHNLFFLKKIKEEGVSGSGRYHLIEGPDDVIKNIPENFICKDGVFYERSAVNQTKE